ncbi:hypothetical protein [Tissierella sp. Yu-01]|uniref:hypothetical protein n=1 Tax=Tissierella sp. Yu-01 TaxID=3035694 RepID=UPI00240D5588|nr:hypothetical protein [Tissierella sp. Yu-01]WFA07810.1 hypothetical protein P3962_08700 [Tissierella sp. Yu-01]
MKKVVVSLLIIVMILSLVTGCGGTQVTSIEKVNTDATQREVTTVIESVDKPGEADEKEIEQKIYSVGERVIIDDMYALTIIGVQETDYRNQFSEKEVEQVLIIDYLYENLNLTEDDLYISDMNFKIVDEGGNMCDSYPASGLYNSEHTPLGAKSLSSMVIGTLDNSSTIKLLYYDNMFDSKSNAEYSLNVGEYTSPVFEGERPSYDNMYSLGDIIEIKTENGDYTLSIDSIELVTDRNQFSEQEPEEVYKIGYTYSNISKEDNLYISDMSFRVIDGNGNMSFAYPGDVTKYPQETIKGAKCSAEAIYGTYTESSELILCYTDNMFSSISDVKILINTK